MLLLEGPQTFSPLIQCKPPVWSLAAVVFHIYLLMHCSLKGEICVTVGEAALTRNNAKPLHT